MTTNKITLKQIDERLGEVRRLGTEFNLYIHETALLIFRHAAPKEVNEDCQGSGDCTRAVRLVRAMPASMRRTMLIQWFHDFTPIRIKLSDHGDKCEFDPKYKKLSKEDKLSWWKAEEAAESPFHVLAEETPETKAFDFSAILKMVESLAKRIEKKLEKGEVPPEDVESAKAAASAIHGLHLVRVKKPEAPANDEAAETERLLNAG